MAGDARIRITTAGLAKAKRGFRGLQGSAGKLGSTLAGIGGGLGLAAGAKAVLDFDQTLGRLQADSGLTNAKMMDLRSSILGLNAQFAVGKDKIAGALQVFQDFGGHVKEGIKILPELTLAAKASGTEMADMATIAATMINAGQGPKEVMKQLAQLQNQADVGTISLKEIASVIPEVFGKGGAKGQTLTGMTALLQTIGEVVPDAQQARTQVLALMRDITKKENAPKLQKMGINPFEIDPKTGKETVKNVGVLMGDILKASKGKISGKKGLGAIFTDESQGALAALMKSFDLKTGKFSGTFKKMNDATQSGSQDIFKIKLDRLNKGIDAEGEKFRRTMAQTEQYFQNVGKQLLTLVAADPAGSIKTALGGAALYKMGPSMVRLAASAAMATPKLIGMAKNIGPAAKAAWEMKGALAGKGGLVLAAAGAGYALGTLIDQTFGFSDALYKGAYAILHPNGPDKAANNRTAGAQSLKDQAVALGNLGASGVKTFGAAGQQKVLNQENAIAALIANAEKQGVTQEQMKTLMPELLAALKKGMAVTIKAEALANPKVAQGRGPAQ